ncbi:WhiB family transcriptional regulator [Micromonospora coerulea]|uniref:WhiB family transcriptional regulator n=1 Tax=Micromonospora coerulea TaxID=47856 RepID=UPI0019049A4F|nr:WhiB family transcriptional regulator [Micromonospora veneta]
MTAACDTNPDLFFSDSPADVEAAKDGCLDCPLSRFNACQAEGWRHEYGVFGGLSGDDRKAADPARYKYLVMGKQYDGARVDKRIIAGRMTETEAAREMGDQSPRDKALALLTAGKTSKEVADTLGVNRNTVRYWAAQARTN